MICDIKMIYLTIRTLVIIDKICLILLIFKKRNPVEERQEEMDGVSSANAIDYFNSLPPDGDPCRSGKTALPSSVSVADEATFKDLTSNLGIVCNFTRESTMPE